MNVLQPGRFGSACGLVAAVLWTLCSGAVAIAPGPMMWVTGHMIHADLAAAGWHLGLGGFLVGLVAWSASAWATGVGVAWTYGRLGSSVGTPARA